MIGINHLGKKYERLANQMFQYAAIKGIAKNRGFVYCIPPSNYADQNDEWSEHQLFSTFELNNLNPLQGQFLDQDKSVVHEETFTFNDNLSHINVIARAQYLHILNSNVDYGLVFDIGIEWKRRTSDISVFDILFGRF